MSIFIFKFFRFILLLEFFLSKNNAQVSIYSSLLLVRPDMCLSLQVHLAVWTGNLWVLLEDAHLNDL